MTWVLDIALWVDVAPACRCGAHEGAAERGVWYMLFGEGLHMATSRGSWDVRELPVRDQNGLRRTVNTLTTVKNAKNPFVTSRLPGSRAPERVEQEKDQQGNR